jgi:hypothetical protein
MIQPSTGAGRHTGAHAAFAIAAGDPVVRDRADPAVPCFSRRTEEEDRRLLSLCLSLSVNDKWVQVCSGSRRSALRVAENG